MQLQIIILSTAYVLILLDYDYPDNEVVSQLNMLPSVVEVNKVEGPYDIVVKLSDDNMSVLKESIGKSHDTNTRNTIHINIDGRVIV